jgi:radical SAM-linked protein
MRMAAAVSRQPEGPPPPPVVQRLRVRYAKRGRLRFTSHRDFARAFERALQRSDVPVAFSAGFSPHPKVSYAGAAPTGAASEAEYLELGLAEPRDPAWVREALDAALPPGLDVLEVVVAEAGQPALADRIEASTWRIELPGVPVAAGEAALAAFLDLDEALVDRPTKDGTRQVDARAAVVAASGVAGTSCATLDVVVRHSTPAVRPDDVVTALRRAAGLSTPVAPVATRLAQGLLDAAPPQDARSLVDPLG